MSNQLLNHSKEAGAVLITGLIFLVVLTMVVLSVLRSGTLEERMAANSRNRQVAIQAAEAVLRDAEQQLFTGADFKSNFDSASLVAGYYGAPVAGDLPRWQTIEWDSTALPSPFVASDLNLAGVDVAPRYIVEIISPPSRQNSSAPCSQGLANVTARGRGVGKGKDSSTVFVQTTYRYQSDGC